MVWDAHFWTPPPPPPPANVVNPNVELCEDGPPPRPHPSQDPGYPPSLPDASHLPDPGGYPFRASVLADVDVGRAAGLIGAGVVAVYYLCRFLALI